MKKSSGGGLTLIVLAAACWSTSGLFINYVVAGSDFSAWGLAFWREVFTGAFLFAGIRLLKPSLLRVKRRDLPWLAAIGGLGMGLLHVTWNMSVVVNGMAVATVLQYNAPFFVAVVSWLVWREPLTRRKVMAVILAFVGTILVSQLDWQAGSQITMKGFLIGLGTAVSFSSISLFGKKLSSDYNTWTILFYTFLFGTLALLPFQIGRPLPHTLSLGAGAAFFGLILVPTIVGYAFYTTGLNRLQSSVAVIVATMEVPFAAIVAYLAFGQRLDGGQILGAILVISGVVLLSWPQKTAKPVPAVAVGRLPQPPEVVNSGDKPYS
ncbi:MAG: EamA family transporter [Ardenticatenaceae bacterium]|nr:EamA family transporter [Ardenticatenaceae bacterium]MCB9446287.1 EamA family transporter [Ardenticatenaceae bacterium]